MSRATSLYRGSSLLGESLLVLRRDGLIVFGDEVSGRYILPSGTGKLSLLDLVRLCDKTGLPKRGLVWRKVVV